MPSSATDFLGHDVRVHRDVPKSVVFVGTDVGGRFSPLGTGFLGGIRYHQFDFFFLITADHVLDMIRGDEIAVRMNRKGMDPITLRCLKGGLKDKQNDIALIQIQIPENHDHHALRLDRNLHEIELRDLWSPDVGDEVVTVGLYASHYGHSRNVPVVRVGNIARMPDDEHVRSTRGVYCSAYLVETRSIVGLSGSPVFLNVPHMTIDPDTDKPRFLTGSGVKAIPIGMMLGYHLVRSAEDQIGVPSDDDDSDPSPDTDERNTGFAVVIPIERIFDMVEHDITIAKIERAIAVHDPEIRGQVGSIAPSLDDGKPLMARLQSGDDGLRKSSTISLSR